MSLDANDLKECSICSSDLEEEDLRGYFGISPVAFCIWCYSCLDSMFILTKGS